VKISFLMPMYDAEETVGAAIDSILDLRTDHEREIIVVDDGSTDGSVEAIGGTYGGRVKVVRKDHGGEASALNEGLTHCTGDVIALAEADVELEPDWLGKVLAAFGDERVIGAGGTLAAFPEDPWIARLAGYEVEAKFAGKPRHANHITSANAAYRRKAFEVAGQFDEKLLNASLDSDFNSRLIEKGFLLAYVPEARARHHYKPTLIEFLKRQYAYARYRVYVRSAALYPADRLLAVNVVLAALLVVSPALIPVSGWIPLGVLAAAVLLQLPLALGILVRRRDAAAFLSPPVLILRNIVAAVGCAVGTVRKVAGERREPG